MKSYDETFYIFHKFFGRVRIVSSCSLVSSLSWVSVAKACSYDILISYLNLKCCQLCMGLPLATLVFCALFCQFLMTFNITCMLVSTDCL